MQVNLVLCKRSGKTKAFPLPSKLTVIGRRHDCDLRIPLISVSKRHCQLNLDEEVLMIRDLGSRNGTSVNGKTIDEAEIKAGDTIEIGALRFMLQIDGVPESFEAVEESAETAVEAVALTDQTKETAEQSGSAEEGLGAESLDEVSESMAESSSLIEDLGDSDEDDTEPFLEDFDMSDDDAESLLDDFDI